MTPQHQPPALWLCDQLLGFKSEGEKEFWRRSALNALSLTILFWFLRAVPQAACLTPWWPRLGDAWALGAKLARYYYSATYLGLPGLRTCSSTTWCVLHGLYIRGKRVWGAASHRWLLKEAGPLSSGGTVTSILPTLQWMVPHHTHMDNSNQSQEVINNQNRGGTWNEGGTVGDTRGRWREIAVVSCG